MSKTIRHFRIELEKWEEFKERASWTKPTKLVREFVEWYTKYHDLWGHFRYFLHNTPCCFLCDKEFEGNLQDKEQKGLFALRNDFKVCLIISKSSYSYRDFEIETRWICKDCYQKIKDLRILKNSIL